MDFNLQPFLTNDVVALRPLGENDFEALYEVASDYLLWEQHQNKDRHTQKAFAVFFDEALQSEAAFVITDNETGQVIGSSRFKIIDRHESVIEIGWSFLSRAYWGGLYNREFKILMVNYALESFKKVIFYVNSKNLRSRYALEKLGAHKIDDFEKSWVLPIEKGITFVIDAPLS